MSLRPTSVLLALVLLLAVTGCATYKYGKVDVLSVDEYASRGTAKGISVAADPYDSTKAEEGFYVDVTSKGFYPVHVIFRNDTRDRLIVLREQVELIDANNNIYRPVRSTHMADACEHSKMAYALLGFGIFSYMSAEEANRKMASDWREKELADQLIIPAGRKMHGFVYFQLPKGQTTEGCKLKLEVEKLETKEKIPLELMLNGEIIAQERATEKTPPKETIEQERVAKKIAPPAASPNKVIIGALDFETAYGCWARPREQKKAIMKELRRNTRVNLVDIRESPSLSDLKKFGYLRAGQYGNYYQLDMILHVNCRGGYPRDYVTYYFSFIDLYAKKVKEVPIEVKVGDYSRPELRFKGICSKVLASQDLNRVLREKDKASGK